MIEAAVAALALALAVVDPPETPADWYKRPSNADVRAVWPAAALKLGSGGVAEILCRVNVHGAAEDCRVVSETPANKGFGEAALMLTPQFLFKPATVGGVAAPSEVRIPITFQGTGTDVSEARDLHELDSTVSMIDRPVWASAPTFADMASVYPAKGGGLAGYVAFRCDVKKDDSLRGCLLVREEPPRHGFESAARRLTAKFRLHPGYGLAHHRENVTVNLRIRIIDPTGEDYVQRRVGQPQWLVGLDPKKAVKLFPQAAIARGLKTGLGRASCRVSAEGALADCSPLPGEPDGVGFSEAAVEIAEVMKMNLWTQEGGPVDGARLILPVRFNLAEGTAAKP